MEIEKLANIEITDEDILWVEEMMDGLKVHRDIYGEAIHHIMSIQLLISQRNKGKDYEEIKKNSPYNFIIIVIDIVFLHFVF